MFEIKTYRDPIWGIMYMTRNLDTAGDIVDITNKLEVDKSVLRDYEYMQKSYKPGTNEYMTLACKINLINKDIRLLDRKLNSLIYGY